MNSQTISEEIPAKWTRVIAALLACSTNKEACRKAKVPVSTLAEWFHNDDFMRAYRQAKRQAFEQAVSKLSSLSNDAVETLREVLHDDKVSARDRILTARTVLEHASANQSADLAEMIEKIEKMMSGHGG